MKIISRYLMAVLVIAFFQNNTIAQTGHVSVGEEAPEARLHVSQADPGATNGILGFFQRTGAGDVGLSFSQKGVSSYSILHPDGGGLAFYKDRSPSSAGTLSMRLSNDGDLFLPSGRSLYVGGATSQGQEGLRFHHALNAGWIDYVGPKGLHLRTSTDHNSQTRMYIDATSGNIGVGINTPVNKLDVGGNIAIGSTYSGSTAAPANGAIIEGNVGIGTESPLSRLHVISPNGILGIFESNSPTATVIALGNSSVGGKWFHMFSTGTNPGAGKLIFGSGPASNQVNKLIMTLDPVDGYVGIGTTNPTAPMHIYRESAGPVFKLASNANPDLAEINSDGQISFGETNLFTGFLYKNMANKSFAFRFNSFAGEPLFTGLDFGKFGFNTGNNLATITVKAANDTDDIMQLKNTSEVTKFRVNNSMVEVSNGNNFIMGGGKIGVGTSSPQAPLHVTGGSANNSGTDIKYFNQAATNIASIFNWQGQTAIFADGNICATAAFIAGASFNFSDSRIKNIIGRSDGAADLERLNRIEITRYRHIDTIANGNAIQTKVIAQQLKEVMPEAVHYTQNYLPDVMQLVQSLAFREDEGFLTVTLPQPHGLESGARIKCLDEKGKELIAEVLAVPNEKSLVFKTDHQPSQLFIFGKQVDDFHIVDYDAIAMLNVSATQELSRKLTKAEQRVSALEEEVQALRAQKAEVEAVKQQLAKLEALLNASNYSAENTTDQ